MSELSTHIPSELPSVGGPIITIQHIEIFDDPHRWKGYKITMNDTTKNITCKISNEQDCCEVYGAHCTNTSLDDFIGAQYHSVHITKDVKDEVEDCGDISIRIDITILTDRGQITIQLYNEHNRYYPHDFFIETEHGMTQEYL